MIWEDNCDGAAGTPPNPALWGRAITESWQSAEELQNYTTSTANAFHNGQGQLVIRAIKGPSGGRSYSSGKLVARLAQTPWTFQHGYFEARIKVPTAIGVWPAFWLLGPDGPHGWPQCGEIDIMEAPSSSSMVGQLHQGTHQRGLSAEPPYWPGSHGLAMKVPFTVGNWGDFHTYAISWRVGEIEFFINGKSTGKVTEEAVHAAGGDWPYERYTLTPILNLAIGGWAGTPDPSWTSQDMLIDYVRIGTNTWSMGC